MGNVVCCECVDTSTVGAIESCGKFSRLAEPGINFLNPFCCETVAVRMSKRVQQLDVAVETKTRDNVFVTLVVSVQYQIVPESLYDAFYRLTDYRSQIRSYVFDVVRATVPKIILDDVFVTKEEIANDVRDELSKVMGTFGFEILQALVTDIDPAPRVKEAMNEINAAQRLRLAVAERAEGDKVTRVKAAEAEAEARYLQGMGISRQRQAIVNGLKDSVADFAGDLEGVSNKEIMELLLLTQYFDMVKDVGAASKGSTLFMTHSPSAVNKVAAELRGVLAGGVVQASAGKPAGQQMLR
ncbi:flagellar associated protein [Scenedesmus sp. NREL 46B-D3]|nr:flagellar associated protein [Scenedesmus sp. NREL 46B-D3]